MVFKGGPDPVATSWRVTGVESDNAKAVKFIEGGRYDVPACSIDKQRGATGLPKGFEVALQGDFEAERNVGQSAEQGTRHANVGFN
jgi:hypothetical protein